MSTEKIIEDEKAAFLNEFKKVISLAVELRDKAGKLTDLKSDLVTISQFHKNNDQIPELLIFHHLFITLVSLENNLKYCFLNQLDFNRVLRKLNDVSLGPSRKPDTGQKDSTH